MAPGWEALTELLLPTDDLHRLASAGLFYGEAALSVSDWSTTAASNTAIAGVSIAEGCPPGNMNNAQREMMAQIRAAISDFALTFLDDVDAAAVRTTLGAVATSSALTALGGLTPVGDRLPYFIGASAADLAPLSTFMRGLLAKADAAELRTSIGAVGVVAASLTNPGYIKLKIGDSEPMLQWGTASVTGDSAGSISYPQAYSSFSICVGSGGSSSASEDGAIRVTSTSISGASLVNTAAPTATFYYIAIGV